MSTEDDDAIDQRRMELTDDYRRAFEHWKSRRPLAGAGAADRMDRAEVHERGKGGHH